MKKLAKSYNPADYEEKIYQRWEKSGYFNPDNLPLPENTKSYTIILPPPNITDKLHLGHSSMLAIEDLLIRFHRMNGYRALWLPGTDHAAIATQNVVEKKLFQEKGLTRHDLGREKFLQEVWKFLEKTQNTILKQIRKMGASLDWSRLAFTLDKPRQKAVAQMFVDMYRQGVIYRGERIVNWCPRCHSTLADDEVEHREQKANLYTFRYWQEFPIPIATTRPETKLGDTAVAVNPKDKRYQKYIGQEFKGKFCGLPLRIKVIADREVDMDFGTGAIGVTPAHSMTDWKMAENNRLEIKKVIDEDGKIRAGFGRFSDLSASEAGREVVKELKENGLLEKVEEIDNALSTCYRCQTTIEPLPSKQWFVSVRKKIPRLGNKSLQEKALEVAQKGEISFIPNRFKKRYLHWMENLHDWCISRQIWFGHRLPVWYKGDEIYVNTKPPKDVENWTQDPDVLDTWFSSGMWTFSTLGWPDNFKNGQKTGDLAKFHPTQVLETGYEILTLWVSRMIMMSLFALEEIPFENVYLHGMVLDAQGQKMSKSKGNGIDPLEVINEYGTDALRLSLLIGNTPGNNIKISPEKFVGMRNLVNKLWNIARYMEIKFQISEIGNEQKDLEQLLQNKKLTLADKWILQKLQTLIVSVTKQIKNYNFSPAGQELKDFTWNDLADWYLEISKVENNLPEKQQILHIILVNLLKLWHPFIPFVTEEIQQELFPDSELLLISPWPKAKKINLKKEISQDFQLLQEIVSGIRKARTEYKLSPQQKIKVIIYSPEKHSLLKEQVNILKNLQTGVEKLVIKSQGTKIKQAHFLALNGAKIYIPLQNIIDLKKERKKTKKEIVATQKFITSLEKKLKNKNFLQKAPTEVVSKEKEKLVGQKNKLKNLNEYLEKIS